jgi:hypothetical protein
MKGVVGLLCAVAVTGCSSVNTEYYEAVQAAAEANSKMAQAKFAALSKIAEGDSGAASAAVMAMALSNSGPPIQPVLQQSQAMQWASILAAPLTSLGMAWMQSDSAKTMSMHNRDVSLARVNATTQSNADLYNTFKTMGVSSNQALNALGVAGLEASQVDYTPFIDGMVSLGTTGLNNLTELGDSGFSSNTAIADAGLSSTVEIGNSSIQGLVNLGTLGLDSSVTLGNTGMTSLVDMGNAGMAGIIDMGNAGMTGITSVTLDGYDTLLSLDENNNTLLNGVWTTYNSSLDNILSTVPQISCTIVNNADGTSIVTCAP